MSDMEHLIEQVCARHENPLSKSFLKRKYDYVDV